MTWLSIFRSCRRSGRSSTTVKSGQMAIVRLHVKSETYSKRLLDGAVSQKGLVLTVAMENRDAEKG